MLKKRFKPLFYLLIFGLVLHITLMFTGNLHLYKAVWYNFAGIDDYQIFPNRTVEPSEQPYSWPVSSNYNEISLPKYLKDTLAINKTVAFLVIKDDSIVYEKYEEDYGPGSFSNSFSMSKSFVSALTGIAIEENKIGSVEDKVVDYLPWLKGSHKDQLKIKHLLGMSSGSDWDESYLNPFSVTTKSYYGNDLLSIMKNEYAITDRPGQFFNYKSGDTQLLAYVIMQASGKSLSEYASEKLWKPLGARNKALWSLDHKGGDEKAYCCFNSNARDFARIGQLYLDSGRWQGKTLIAHDYIKATLQPRLHLKDHKSGEKVDFYGYLWWLIPDFMGQPVYYARGIAGQYIICLPHKDIVIVRLGHERMDSKDHHPKEVYTMIRAMHQMY